MFTIIYDKETKKTKSIIAGSNIEGIDEAIDEFSEYISVENIPAYDIYRQDINVVNGSLVVVDKVLTKDQEESIVFTEQSNRLDFLKQYLDSTDYKTLQYIEGVLPEEDFIAIKARRQKAREEIRELEKSLANKMIK